MDYVMEAIAAVGNIILYAIVFIVLYRVLSSTLKALYYFALRMAGVEKTDAKTRAHDFFRGVQIIQ